MSFFLGFTEYLLPALLMIGGGTIWCSIGFFPLLHPVRSFRDMLPRRSSSGGVSPIAGMSLALAGTLGVGNIVGVALALSVGGAGSIFWMWVCGFFASAVKYSEIVLTQSLRRKNSDGEYEGSAALYIQSSTAAAVFSFCALLLSLTLGAMLQGNAISDICTTVFGTPSAWVGVAVLLLALPVVLLGVRRLAGVTCLLLPIACITYIGMCVGVIAANIQQLPGAFGEIFASAFSFRSAAGGVLGGIFASPAIRQGAARGLLSNEAGCGTSPMAHAAADSASPKAQGLLGVLEVVIDTHLLCTLTALALLCGGSLDGSPSEMLSAVFSSVFGRAGELLLAATLFLFAFSTIVCWSHYGKVSLHYVLRDKRFDRGYLIIYSFFALVGCLSAPSFVWSATDLLLGIMTVINVIAVLSHRRRIRDLSQ